MSLLSAGLTGLSHATPIFLVAAALTLVFGATRVLDFSQAAITGLAAALVTRLSLHPAVLFIAVPAALAILAAILEQPLFRRLERAPLLSQLLVTFGLSLLLHDLAQLVWTVSTPPASAWLQARFTLGDFSVPVITLAVIAAGPTMLGLLLTHTAWPRRFVVPLAVALSSLAGLLCLLDRQVPSTGFDLDLLADALLALLLGGLGSLPGAFIAALVIGLVEAFAAELFPHAALVLPLALTAILLLFRPNGLLGRAYPTLHRPPTLLIRPAPRSAKLLLAVALLLALSVPILAPSALPFLTNAAIAILLAASLHFLIGPGGIPSLGHAAFFVIGAYASALFLQNAGLSPTLPLIAAALAIGTLAAGLAAAMVGAVLIRLSATALAMLTLVVAHLVSTVTMAIGPVAPFQPGLLRAPIGWLAPAIGSWLTLAICLGTALLLRRVLYAPFGYALRAARDNPVRAAASGLPISLLRLAAFVLTGVTAGLAGAVSMIAIGIDPALNAAAALVMLALGGFQAMAAPVVGALAYTGGADAFPALLGPALIALPLLLPEGIAGSSIRLWRRAR